MSGGYKVLYSNTQKKSKPRKAVHLPPELAPTEYQRPKITRKISTPSNRDVCPIVFQKQKTIETLRVHRKNDPQADRFAETVLPRAILHLKSPTQPSFLQAVEGLHTDARELPVISLCRASLVLTSLVTLGIVSHISHTREERGTGQAAHPRLFETPVASSTSRSRLVTPASKRTMGPTEGATAFEHRRSSRVTYLSKRAPRPTNWGFCGRQLVSFKRQTKHWRKANEAKNEGNCLQE